MANCFLTPLPLHANVSAFPGAGPKFDITLINLPCRGEVLAKWVE